MARECLVLNIIDDCTDRRCLVSPSYSTYTFASSFRHRQQFFFVAGNDLPGSNPIALLRDVVVRGPLASHPIATWHVNARWSLCVDMCVDTCAGMRVDMCVATRAYTCVDVCTNVQDRTALIVRDVGKPWMMAGLC